MRMISAQPAQTYFAWQLAVQLENFREVGVDLKECVVLLADQGGIPDEIFNLIGRYAPEGVQFHIYEDSRERRYLPSVRFHLLAQHFHRYPEMQQERFFYHDADIIFRELPDLKSLPQGTWFSAYAGSYLDVRYIQSKGPGLLENMCSIIGVSPRQVKYSNLDAGGVQYVLEDVPATFWKKCEIDSEKMYRFLVKAESAYAFLHNVRTGLKNYHPLQAWTTDMWVLWWNALKEQKTFRCHDMLSFSWATDPIEKWDLHYIFHNAGVMGGDLFDKNKYKEQLPFGQPLTTDERCCSWYYVEQIKRTPWL